MKLFALLSIVEAGYSSKQFKVFLIALNMDFGANKATSELVQSIHQHISSNWDKDSIRQRLMTSFVQRGIVYLNEYLYAQDNDEPLDLTISNIEIEHIMPSSGKNISAIRQDANLGDDFARYADSLGNKVLLERNINGSISNDWFRVKKLVRLKASAGTRTLLSLLPKALLDTQKTYGKGRY